MDNVYKNWETGFDVLRKLLEDTTGIKKVRSIELNPRTLQFEIRGITYQIIWYVNTMILVLDSGMQVMFENMHNRNTWPANYEASLQFLDRHDDTICVLPIKKHCRNWRKGRERNEKRNNS